MAEYAIRTGPLVRTLASGDTHRQGDQQQLHRVRLEVTPHIRGIPKISRSEVAVFLLKSTVNGLFNRQIVVLRPV